MSHQMLAWPHAGQGERVGEEPGAFTDGFRTIINTGRIGHSGGVSSPHPYSGWPRAPGVHAKAQGALKIH